MKDKEDAKRAAENRYTVAFAFGVAVFLGLGAVLLWPHGFLDMRPVNYTPTALLRATGSALLGAASIVMGCYAAALLWETFR